MALTQDKHAPIDRVREALERIRDFPYVGVQASHAIVSIARDGLDALSALQRGGGMDVNSPEAALWSETMRLKSENEHLRAQDLKLVKRPVAWRVNDPANGWIIFEKEEAAYRCSEACGGKMQGLYVRDGTPLLADERGAK